MVAFNKPIKQGAQIRFKMALGLMHARSRINIGQALPHSKKVSNAQREPYLHQRIPTERIVEFIGKHIANIKEQYS